MHRVTRGVQTLKTSGFTRGVLPKDHTLRIEETLMVQAHSMKVFEFFQKIGYENASYNLKGTDMKGPTFEHPLKWCPLDLSRD